MYMTAWAGSPCAKIVAFRGNSAILLAIPAESRKAWALKPRFCVDSVWDLVFFELAITRINLPYCSRVGIVLPSCGRTLLAAETVGRGWRRQVEWHRRAIDVPEITVRICEFYRDLPS